MAEPHHLAETTSFVHCQNFSAVGLSFPFNAAMPIQAVKATDRKNLLVAGITTEVCVLFPVLQMLEEDYEVQVSADASASWSKHGDDLTLRRMEDAGAVITTADQIIAELAIDWTSPNGQKLRAILDYR